MLLGYGECTSAGDIYVDCQHWYYGANRETLDIVDIFSERSVFDDNDT